MTKHIFFFSLAILTGSLIWILKIKQDIDQDIKRPVQEIFGGELVHNLQVLKSIRTSQADLGELYDKSNDISVSVIWPAKGQTAMWPEDALAAAKEYKLKKRLPEGSPSFVITYLSAHFDARRITIMRNFPLNFKEMDYSATTFRLKDERYYGLVYSEKLSVYVLASNQESPLTGEQLTGIIESIPRLSQATPADHEHAQELDQQAA